MTYRAPKAGALPGCATPRHEVTSNYKALCRFLATPAPLVSAQMFDFGDAVVMTCQHQPYTGKPVHVSRLWIKKNGQWVISISYQTTIQAAPAMAS